jgi:ribonuclease HII
MAALINSYSNEKIEAGCDEAGRGCLAGPVFAAAVIFPENYRNEALNDSKKLSARQRDILKEIILQEALTCAVARVDAPEIDKINILNASFLAMHLAIKKLKVKPELLLIDGNRFKNQTKIPHVCVVKGDGKYMSIAAASILAKTYRDEYMLKLHKKYPTYGWNRNKGYPTHQHKMAIYENGLTQFHRKSFNYNLQLRLGF